MNSRLAIAEAEKLMGSGLKRCGSCKNSLSIEVFGPNKQTRDGFRSVCRPCGNTMNRAYKKRNPEKVRAAAKKANAAAYAKRQADPGLRAIERERVRLAQAKLRATRTPKRKAEAVANQKAYRAKDVGNKRRKAWRKADRVANPDKYAKRRARRYSSPGAKVARTMRSRMWRVIRNAGCEKDFSTFAAIGYTPEELTAHLQARFLPGMTWENYGHDTWHIDHVRPVDSFDEAHIEGSADFAECWGLANLQPLWADDNMSKGAKWVRPNG